MREICHIQAGQCGNQIGAKVIIIFRQYNIIINYNTTAYINIIIVGAKFQNGLHR